MTIDPESLGLGAAFVAAIGGAFKWLTTRTQANAQRAEGIDGVLANALAHEQAEHKTTRNELSQSRTNESMALAQAATFGAQIEALTERFDDLESRLAKSEAQNDECESRCTALLERVRQVERRQTPNGTPIVTEQTGGYRVRNPGG